MSNIYDYLLEYSKGNYYPMHMPGHKRNIGLFSAEIPYQIDITEIDGFDNLHDPQGIIKDAQKRAANLYHSEKTYFLINGSTCGILAGICGITKKGDRVLIARNCHMSVYNAVFLNELRPVYIYPPLEKEFEINGSIYPVYVEEMLITYPDISLIVITSPTYEGVVSDIKEIARIAHERGIPLLVDEAHGAHFGFYKYFPDSSIGNNADIVIHSVHKTLPALTQTALMHINGNIVCSENIEKYLKIYQSSSPSYVLMSSIDKCIEFLEQGGENIFIKYYNLLERFYERTKSLKNIKVLKKEQKVGKTTDIFNFDPLKINLSVKDTTLTGMELYDILLNDYRIQLEMVSKNYVIAMSSVCDTCEGFERLLEALFKIDKNIVRKKCNINNKSNESIILDIKLTSYEAYRKIGEKIPLDNSEGRIAKEYVYLYPPGIPLAVPGEVISKKLIEKIKDSRKNELLVKGITNTDVMYIDVVL